MKLSPKNFWIFSPRNSWKTIFSRKTDIWQAGVTLFKIILPYETFFQKIIDCKTFGF